MVLEIKKKKKGKTAAHNAEGSVLHALRSSLRFQNVSWFQLQLFKNVNVCHYLASVCFLFIDTLSRSFNSLEKTREWY